MTRCVTAEPIWTQKTRSNKLRFYLAHSFYFYLCTHESVRARLGLFLCPAPYPPGAPLFSSFLRPRLRLAFSFSLYLFLGVTSWM